MNKPLSLLTGLLLLAAATYGQDTAKKVQKSTTPVTKPVYKPVPYGYRPVVAQPPAQPVDNSLNGQYNTVFKMAEHWQQAPILAYHKSVMDTLSLERRKLRDANSKLAVQAITIADLKGSVSSKDQNLAESKSMVDSISFLGIKLSKAMYNVLMWGLVIVLGGSLIAVIYLSASNKREAAYRIKLYEELTEEFTAYKAKANEKEKKLARELQTERNKLDELMGR